MKKKILALILASAMALSFSGCFSFGGDEKPSGGGNNISNEDKDDEKDSDKDEKDSDDEKDSEDDEKNNESFKHGKITSKGYKSSFFDIEIEFGDDLSYYDDDYLAEQNGIDDMSDKNVNKALEENGTIYELEADIDSGSTINIVVENTNITSGVIYSSGKNYLEENLSVVENTLEEDEEILLESIEMSTIKICGKRTPCIKAEATVDGTKVILTVLAEVNGEYLAYIQFTALSEDDLDTLTSAFTSIG